MNVRAQPPVPDSPPRKRKRPGQGARISVKDRQAAENLRRQHEEEEKIALQNRLTGSNEVVADHYNAVPERGREWRKTDSQIKGLRSMNNWIKSTLIQKFSRSSEQPTQHLHVLDMACGKGGDLGKWEKAPQMPALYVGCDIAEVSIEQATQRYQETLRKNNGRHRRRVMHAEFYVQDTFGESLGRVPTIRNLALQFDVVSMMFALHYSFEKEETARQMLKNVSGALKKGGRFIGVLPNSDIISAKVKAALQIQSPTGAGDGADSEDEWDPEKPAEKPVEESAAEPGDDDDDWDPEKPAEEPLGTATAPSDHAAPLSTPLEFGNSIYKVRFPPQKLPLPKDGGFRPPYGWKYHYSLEEAVDAPEYVVPWEGFRALAEDFGLELMYRKSFQEIWEDEQDDPELGMLAERMGVRSRDRSEPNGGLRVTDEEMEACAFYHAFCFYKI